MKIKLYINLINVFYLLFILLLFADQKATTEDGKKVLLKDDGTWRYITQSDLIAEKLGKSSSKDFSAPSGKIEDELKNPSTYDLLTDSRKTKEKYERAALTDAIIYSKDYNVRKTKWGMTKEEVKRSETIQLIKEGTDFLEYKHQLIGLNTKIKYNFTNARLSSVEYIIEQDDVNPARFYEDYIELKRYLRNTYGNPVSDEKIWKNDIYKNDEKNWGFAIAVGFLECKTIWQNESTVIKLIQTGGNHIINTYILYSAKMNIR